MKFQDDISFRNIIDAKFQCPTFRKGQSLKNYHIHCFQFFTIYFIHQPLSADTCYKFLALIYFKIRHLRNFIHFFSKGRNFTRGDNSEKIGVCYFSMRNPYMKVSRRYLDAPYIHTDKSKPICSPRFQSWGHKDAAGMDL